MTKSNVSFKTRVIVNSLTNSFLLLWFYSEPFLLSSLFLFLLSNSEGHLQTVKALVSIMTCDEVTEIVNETV